MKRYTQLTQIQRYQIYAPETQRTFSGGDCGGGRGQQINDQSGNPAQREPTRLPAAMGAAPGEAA